MFAKKFACAALALPFGSTISAAASVSPCIPPPEVSNAKIVREEQNGVLVLSDGRAAKLEGLLLPNSDKDRAPGSLRHQAIRALSELSQSSVMLAARPPKEDRYDRIRAQVLLRQNPKEPWLQLAMLRRGLARVFVAPDRPECARELYAAEQEARAARRGLWASSAYAIRTPSSLRSTDFGTFQLVEGKALNAVIRGGRAYVNFGSDWRTDFTVSISPQDMKRFHTAGIDPESFAGKTIRVRGWIERMNGPEITVASPAEIEVVSKQ